MAFNFADIMEPQGTLIVDTLNIAFRYKHTKRSDFRYELIKTAESLAHSYKCGEIIFTADWGSSTYRKGLTAEYKADRAEKYKDQIEEDRIAFEEFFEEYEITLKVAEEAGYKVLRYKGVEADDIAAHLVKNRKRYELKDIWLISSDRDWGLLVQEGVSQFSTVTRKEYTLDNWDEHYAVSPEQYISYKVILGDSGDNIKGFAGIGPKRASDLILQYDSAVDIYDQLPIDSKYKYMEDLNANPDRIMLNYELMDLIEYCDEAIGEENLQDIRLKMGDVKW